MNIAIVGGGIFGVTAALELRRRDHEVTILQPDVLPHPLAESTDISKVVRMDYGADDDYTQLGRASIAGWRSWNAGWPRPLYHETGVTFLSRTPMQPGSFEHESFTAIERLLPGALERLDESGIARRFPAFRAGELVDGYYNSVGGWAESGAVVAQLAEAALTAGVVIARRQVTDLAEVRADLTIVCAGAWTATLVPEVAGSIRAIGQPVFHLRPDDPAMFRPDQLPVFGADISTTGYYGFPITADGVVKVANHGTGIAIARDDERVVNAAQEADLRAFLARTMPSLASAPIVHRRLCVYADTLDGHFWIARHPTRDDLVVATGGSGHAFKFAPMLGRLIANIALGTPDEPLAHKFRWRPELAAQTRGDAARADR